MLRDRLNPDVFNLENEPFPQEERLLENEYSVNLPRRYQLKSAFKKGWINIINPFRSILVAGSGGAGKTYFVIRHIIDQQIRKGFAMFLYDFKFDDLTRLAYNKLLRYHGNYAIRPAFISSILRTWTGRTDVIRWRRKVWKILPMQPMPAGRL